MFPSFGVKSLPLLFCLRHMQPFRARFLPFILHSYFSSPHSFSSGLFSILRCLIPLKRRKSFFGKEEGKKRVKVLEICREVFLGLAPPGEQALGIGCPGEGTASAEALEGDSEGKAYGMSSP